MLHKTLEHTQGMHDRCGATSNYGGESPLKGWRRDLCAGVHTTPPRPPFCCFAKQSACTAARWRHAQAGHNAWHARALFLCGAHKCARAGHRGHADACKVAGVYVVFSRRWLAAAGVWKGKYTRTTSRTGARVRAEILGQRPSAPVHAYRCARACACPMRNAPCESRARVSCDARRDATRRDDHTTRSSARTCARAAYASSR